MPRIEDADALPFQAQELADTLNRVQELGLEVLLDDAAISLRNSDGREVRVEQNVLGDESWDYYELEDR